MEIVHFTAMRQEVLSVAVHQAKMCENNIREQSTLSNRDEQFEKRRPGYGPPLR
jgi:hypothetical protein